jgi:hypothetical protein
MDTSGFYPSLSNDDPLFEVADYSQLMKTKLTEVNSVVLAVPNSGVYPALPANVPTTVNYQLTSFGYNVAGDSTFPVTNGEITIPQAGFYFISSVVTFNDMSAWYTHSVMINGVEKVRGFSYKPNNQTYFQYSSQTTVVKLALGDKIKTVVTAENGVAGAIRDLSAAGNVMSLTLLAPLQNA